MLLLDTHAWLWAVEGDARRLGRRTRQTLSRAERTDAVRVSVASVFEVAALHTLGRVRFSVSLESWLREATGVPGIRLAELSPSVAIEGGAVPRGALADPLDRLLVATARVLDATLVTADERILHYAAATGNVRTHDARR